MFLGTWVLFAILQRQYLELPAYHDGRYWWDKSAGLADRIWFPFLAEYDAGHPPLVGWLVALAWQLPVPRMPAMHVVLWAFPALFVTTVFESTRRVFGIGAAVIAGLLTACHPTVVAQAVQLNLDLPLAAFAWLAILAAVAGCPAGLAAALTAVALCKLNGLFLLVPFALWCVLRLAWRGELLRGRAVACAAWPLLVPVAAFALYHAMKWRLTGHLFDTGEFEGGHQIAFVRTMWDFGYRVFNNIMQGSNHNGNWFVVAALVVLLPLVLAMSVTPTRRAATAQWWTEQPAGSALTRAEFVALLLLVVLSQVMLHAMRSIYAIERYFILCYPVLFVLLGGAVTVLARGRARLLLALAVVAPLLAVFCLKWHPANLDRFPPALRSRLVYLPDDICSNHEQSLEFADLFGLMRDAMRELERERPGEPRFLDVWWPFDLAATDPAQGITPTAHHLSRHPETGEPDYRFVFSMWACRQSPDDVLAAHPGFHQGWLGTKGRLWLLVLRHDSLAAAE
ncbi:MAG: hypothetical protein KF858_12365 [Candidatus Sumerlaeia bacterium]|nr:hypothetical protein [Candidatus Sumerlaeia bacterium]